MKGIKELETVLLDQIEKLNDDSIGEDKEAINNIVSRSKAISDLANNYIAIQSLKIQAVNVIEKTQSGTDYYKYLGIE